jgi:hypothetical protein
MIGGPLAHASNELREHLKQRATIHAMMGARTVTARTAARLDLGLECRALGTRPPATTAVLAVAASTQRLPTRPAAAQPFCSNERRAGALSTSAPPGRPVVQANG